MLDNGTAGDNSILNIISLPMVKKLPKALSLLIEKELTLLKNRLAHRMRSAYDFNWIDLSKHSNP